jgi:RNA polymerase sigma factor (sigma-70 family)
MSAEVERALIARAQAGDVAARNAVAERHLGLIARLASHYLGPSAEAEDWRQEATLGVLEAIPRIELDRETKPSTFLRWQILGSLKAALRQQQREARGHRCASLSTIQDNDTAAADRADELRRMEAAYAGLNPLDRWILEQRHLEGRPVREVAKEMKRREEVVRKLERAALVRLRMLMGVE